MRAGGALEPPLRTVVSAQVFLEHVPARPTVIDSPHGKELAEAEAPFALAGESGHRPGHSQVSCPFGAVRDGREALAALGSGLLPCLIVLDLPVPGMDGWQFRRAPRGSEELAKIPVVVVSGVEAARNSALQCGAVALLPKPVAPQALLSAVDSAC